MTPGDASEFTRHEDRYLLQALEIESRLRQILWHITRNEADVEELLQETYVRLLKAGASRRPEIRSVHAVAITTAKRLASDRWRHKLVAPEELVADLSALDIVDECPLPDEIVDQEQRVQRVWAAIREFPERVRTVFILHKAHGYTYSEIARRLKMSEWVVKDDLSRAANLLPEALSRQSSTGWSGPHPDQPLRGKKPL
jgi:RNA polymerase sigma factor (sigma-70 family)